MKCFPRKNSKSSINIPKTFIHKDRTVDSPFSANNG